jgi:hypothetical protein
MENFIDFFNRAIKSTIQNLKFLSLNCDEITLMDNASYANIHAYAM